MPRMAPLRMIPITVAGWPRADKFVIGRSVTAADGPAMNVVQTEIPEVLIIEPKQFGDSRGFFMETYQFERYAGHGISRSFDQDNLSRSSRGVVRGLHLQNPKPQ